MELEFDKEMDAILRRARETRGVLVGDDPPKIHLDADTIAAFAENALPQKAKLLYMEHFADCDRCRQLLSQSILFNSEADRATASSVSTPITEPVIPWYQTLFKTQNLALAMGSLVLAFGGVLGILLLQNRNTENKSSVSQVSEPQITPGGPYYSGDSTNADSNIAAAPSNSAASVANMPSNSSSASSEPSANKPASATGKFDSATSVGVSPDDCQGCASPAGGEKPREMPMAAAAPPPAPIALDGTVNDRDEKKAEDDKLKELNKDLGLAKRKMAEDRGSTRDAAPSPAKTGPSRSGPLQNQSNKVNNNIFDMTVKRKIGGKTFDNRNGAWYDSAYRGQTTTNYRRGTDEYKKLDRGLRNIADSIGGTVVVVWKEKAYRIQ